MHFLSRISREKGSRSFDRRTRRQKSRRSNKNIVDAGNPGEQEDRKRWTSRRTLMRF
ncbi:hypothetical protein GCWU000341_02704 [Oribacterium sp. oral taxon 078 str. F0262]|nr:hypothetical protein GCWU000341_02704 [Oribacterium sp. oral taxon 078 str. F0262]